MEHNARPRPLAPPPQDGGLIVDLFAGPGGWSTGLRAVGLHDIGVEWDAAACATRVAEGHLTIKGDVSKIPTEPFRGRTHMLIASPPCQSFSLAGKKQGRPTAFLDALAGRYDQTYAAELLAEIREQQRERDAWQAEWRMLADAHGWWAAPGADSLEALRLDAPTCSDGSGGRGADGLSFWGVRERLRLLGPAPVVEDERGMYMAETVRWISLLDHPTKVAMERAVAVALFSFGRLNSQPRGVFAGQGMSRRGNGSRPRTDGLTLRPLRNGFLGLVLAKSVIVGATSSEAARRARSGPTPCRSTPWGGMHRRAACRAPVAHVPGSGALGAAL